MKTMYYYLFRPARISTTQNVLYLSDEMAPEMEEGSYLQHNIHNINEHDDAINLADVLNQQQCEMSCTESESLQIVRDNQSTNNTNGLIIPFNIEKSHWQQFILSVYNRFMRIFNEKMMITNWFFYRKYRYTKSYFENDKYTHTNGYFEIDKYRQQNNFTFYVIYHKISNFMPLTELDIMQICEMNTDDKMKIIRLFIACINCLYEYINIYDE
jgi:hypothetical protein